MDTGIDGRSRTLAVSISVVAVALFCVTLIGPAGADDDNDDGGEFVSRQIVVKLASTANVGEINKKYGTMTIETLLGSSRIYLLETPQAADPDILAGKMRSDTNRLRRVIYVEPNFKIEPPEASRRHKARPGGEPTPGSDPSLYRSQYAVDSLNLTQAHATNRGAGAVVAVIDTGVQADHPQLSGKMIAGYDFIDDDGLPLDATSATDGDGDGQTNELVGHGTHVAGIVGLVAPEAKIMPIRALDPDGWGNVFVLAEAINYAARNGADVINLSLGSSGESDLIEDVIANAVEGDEGLPGGAVVVAAAGNENTDQLQYPAATGYEEGAGKDFEEGVLAVASVDQQRIKSSFSNYGAWVDIAAPGTEIYSAFPGSRYATWDGTSMATPFVAAQAALLYGEARTDPEDKAMCISNAIMATAQPLTTPALGAGHADAGASVKYLRSTGCAPS